MGLQPKIKREASYTTAIQVAVFLLLFLINAETNAQSNVIILRAGHSANTNEPYHIGLVEFARLVKEKSKGRVEVRIYPNNQLGNEKEMVEGLLLGTLDITVPSNGVVTNFVPKLGILDLPFLFRDRNHMYTVMDGHIGEELNKSLQEKGFRLLGFYEAGIRHIMSTTRPINSFKDLAGLKIRTMGVPEHVASFNAFGANAVPLAYGELYGALQTGLVDGAEAANTNYHSKKFYEVAPYWAHVGWTALVADLMMSERRFNTLPKDIQGILLESGLQSTTYERQTYADSDNRLLDELKTQGVEVTYPDLKPFREASKSVYDAFVKNVADRKLLDAILTTK